jgi:hypothetical protein
MEGVQNVIEDDKRQMSRTFGGLVSPWNGTRHYRVFEAAWKEIKL